MNKSKYIPTFESFLETLGNELNEGKKYPYGCAMLQFDFPEMKIFHEKIDPKDLADSGFETEPHVTLLYGLHEDVNPDDVKDICINYSFETLTLHNCSSFNSEKFDVLKFDVKGENLFECNEELAQLPHTTDHPDYHPHSTIAYLKKGTAKKYIKLLEDKEYKVIPEKIVYSLTDGSNMSWKITKQEKDI